MPARPKKKDGHFPFDHDYQGELLHLMLRSGSFLRENRGALRAEAFGDPIHQVIATIVLEHFDTYGAPPSKGFVQEEIRTGLEDGVAGVSVTSLRRSFTSIWALEGVRPGPVAQKVRDFSAQTLATQVIAQRDDYWASGKHEEWLDELGKALSLRHPEPAFVRYGEGITERFQSYSKGFQKTGAVPTGLKRMDSRLGGGLGEGELGCILGLTGAGKSQVLVNFGAAAAERGHKVDHVTLEMCLGTLLRRYDRRLTKLLEKEIAKKYRAMSKKLGTLGISCAQYPSYQLTPKALLSAIARRGTPDLLIVDYGPIMASDYGTEQERFRVAEIFSGLRNIATDLRCPVWTAIQVNRSGKSSTQSEGEVITSFEVSESWMAMGHCDEVITSPSL